MTAPAGGARAVALRAAEETLPTITAIFGSGSPEALEAQRHLAVMHRHGNGDGDLEAFFVAEGRFADVERRARIRMGPAGDGDRIAADQGKPRILSPSPGFVPFPMASIPAPLRRYVENGAEVVGCDESFIVLPLLSALAGAVGATHRIELKRGWEEPAIVWSAVVAASGTLKSPALDHALAPTYAYQRQAVAGFIDQREDFERESLEYEKALTAWKRGKASGSPPDKPEAPKERTYWTSDATVEALGAVLADNPRGTLLVRDELSAWLGSFDRYTGGSADAGNWLQMFGGRPLRVHRKTAPTLYIPSASVSICGGIQPGTLQRAIGSEHREDGLLARLLVACPPRRPRRWSEAEADPTAAAAVHNVFERLCSLEMTVAEDGTMGHHSVKLDGDAKAHWIAFYNSHGENIAELDGDLAAAFSKLEGYAARFALIVHMARWAADPQRDRFVVDVGSIDAGVAVARWFSNETIRVYGILSESHEQREQRALIDWIAGRGGEASERDLARGPRRYRNDPEAAEKALAALVAEGLGTWQPVDHSGPGRPSRLFRLRAGPGDEIRGNLGNPGILSPSPAVDREPGEEG